MAKGGTRSLTIQPLDGGYGGYIATLDKVREQIEMAQLRTRDDVISWYARELRKPEGNHDRGDATTRNYINSLFRCGLLKDAGDAPIECTFPRRRNKAQRIIEIIDDNIVYVLDMLYEAHEGASEEDLHEVGKSKYELGPRPNQNQIWWRRGWLQSAGMLEVRDDKRMFATKAGVELLKAHGFDVPASPPRPKPIVNPAEFGGGGEGVEHKTLKELVHNDCHKILRAVRGRRVKVTDRHMEYDLPSGDRVDVSARDQESVCWHIEVKSKISSAADLERGLYQCVKYKAVAEAKERVDRTKRSVESLLVIEDDLPSPALKNLAEQLGVHVHRVSEEMRRDLARIRRKRK